MYPSWQFTHRCSTCSLKANVVSFWRKNVSFRNLLRVVFGGFYFLFFGGKVAMRETLGVWLRLNLLLCFYFWLKISHSMHSRPSGKNWIKFPLDQQFENEFNITAICYLLYIYSFLRAFVVIHFCSFLVSFFSWLPCENCAVLRLETSARKMMILRGK